MVALVLTFPDCVRGDDNRTTFKKSLEDTTLDVHLEIDQIESSTREDTSALTFILSKQKNLASVTFKHVTFYGFVAQLIVGMMVRSKAINFITFDTCDFKNYQRYACNIRNGFSRVQFFRCRITPSARSDFIAFLLRRAKRFIYAIGHDAHTYTVTLLVTDIKCAATAA